MAILTPKLDSVHEMSPRALGELKAWLEPWFLNQNKCCATAPEPLAPFSEAIATLAATRDLRGYWRLGEGGGGPYADTSGAATLHTMTKYSTAPFNTPVMSDLATGALPTADDDGAVGFGSSAGTWGEHLRGSSSVAFDDVQTICGWVKASVSANTFDGGIFSTRSQGATAFGFVLGVQWPTRNIFYEAADVSGEYRTAGPVVTADEWVFACAVNDGGTVSLYLDGALVATGAAVVPEYNPSFAGIGLWNSSAGAGAGQGTLYGGVDEVSVWGGALTAAEIATLAASGGLAEDPTVRSVVSTTGAYTANPGETVFADGTFTVTLPTAVGNLGAEVTVKNIGAGTITVAQDGSEEIDGSATDLSLGALDAVTVVSDAGGWWAIGVYP